ncbi:hypothetical protein LXL04_001620 [Taraxacum kok-saghyz]
MRNIFKPRNQGTLVGGWIKKIKGSQKLLQNYKKNEAVGDYSSNPELQGFWVEIMENHIKTLTCLHTMLSMLFDIIELSFVIYTDQAGNQENQKITDIVVRTSQYTKSSAKRSPPVIVNQDNSKAGTSKNGNLKKKGKKIQDLRTPTKKITQESRQSPRLQLLEYSKCVTPLQSDDSLVKGKKATCLQKKKKRK